VGEGGGGEGVTEGEGEAEGAAQGEGADEDEEEEDEETTDYETDEGEEVIWSPETDAQLLNATYTYVYCLMFLVWCCLFVTTC
jgi:hypothetical protein